MDYHPIQGSSDTPSRFMLWKRVKRRPDNAPNAIIIVCRCYLELAIKHTVDPECWIFQIFFFFFSFSFKNTFYWLCSFPDWYAGLTSYLITVYQVQALFSKISCLRGYLYNINFSVAEWRSDKYWHIRYGFAEDLQNLKRSQTRGIISIITLYSSLTDFRLYTEDTSFKMLLGTCTLPFRLKLTFLVINLRMDWLVGYYMYSKSTNLHWRAPYRCH